MKTKISPYIKYLFVQNAVYIFFAAVLLISLFIIPPVMFSTYTKNSENIDQLQKDILDLKSKKNTLAFISGSDLKNIDNYYDLVSALIPESENYFSIIYTLSNLSELTNFNISSYSINLQGSTNNKIPFDRPENPRIQALITVIAQKKIFIIFQNRFAVTADRQTGFGIALQIFFT